MRSAIPVAILSVILVSCGQNAAQEDAGASVQPNAAPAEPKAGSDLPAVTAGPPSLGPSAEPAPDAPAKALTEAEAAAADAADKSLLGGAHYGTGPTQEEALKAARDSARARALRKDTCYRPPKAEDCTFDGTTYTCVAFSANHAGSCSRSGYVSGRRWPPVSYYTGDIPVITW